MYVHVCMATPFPPPTGYFIRPMYKLLLDKKLVLSDMEAVDTEFYNSVKYILDNDPEPLCLTFTSSREFLGKVRVHTCMCIAHTHKKCEKNS